MLGIILKILCILGWIVLFLLALLILTVLLILFFPVSYCISWQKDAASMTVSARLKWLFGMITGSFDFPQPGALIVKLFGIVVFDSGKSGDGQTDGEDQAGSRDHSGNTSGKASGDASADTAAANADSNANSTEVADTDRHSGSGGTPNDGTDSNNADTPAVSTHSDSAGTMDTDADSSCADTPDADGSTDTPDADSSADTNEASGIFCRIKSLLQKLLQTIRQLFDKLKHTKERADAFLAILKAEDTRLLFSYVMSRTGRILKSIRPRKIEGQLTFGTGSPDTTGYGMALYGMLSPFLGQNLSVTPDFEEAVLEGQLFAKGRIFMITLLYNGLRILLDRRLRQFIRKIKREVK